LDTAVVEQQATQPATERDVYDIIILGGGPTGLFGAFYAGLREMKTKIVEGLPELGGQLTALYPEKFIYDVPGYPKVLARDLVAQLVEQTLQFDQTVCVGERAIKLERDEANNLVVLTTDKAVHYAKTVVIAGGVGAFSPTRLDAPGVGDYEGKGVYFFVKEKAPFAGKEVLIVGGGDSAADWSLAFKDIAKVTLIHRRDHFRAHETSVRAMAAAKEAGELDIRTFHELKEVHGDGERITEVILLNNQTQETMTIPCEVVLLNLGFKADLGPIKEWGLELEKRAIRVNERMETNIPGVYAAGDIAGSSVKLNLIATGFGQAATAVCIAKNYIDPKSSIFPGHSSEKE